jgi:hypothetical protein
MGSSLPVEVPTGTLGSCSDTLRAGLIPTLSWWVQEQSTPPNSATNVTSQTVLCAARILIVQSL